MRAAVRLLSALAALILCLLAYTAGSWGLADLFARQPRGAMKLWDAGKAMPGPGEIEAARGALEAALRLKPGDPGIKEELGRVHTRAAAQPIGPRHVSPHAEAALSYFRAAVRERPVSSYAWAAMVTTQWRMRRVDAEFERALQEAARLGPWEPEVQLAVADAGLQSWQGLSEAAQRAVLAAIGRALRYQDAAVFALARRHGRLDVVCRAQGVARSRFAYACI